MSGFSITDLDMDPGLFGGSSAALLKGRLGLCPLPASASAMAALVAWHPVLVLSLTETDEMAAFGAGDLPHLLAVAGIGWRHLPVRDYGVPKDAAAWTKLEVEILRVLAMGGRVAIHCRGGCGRTGMVALRLMVAAGEAADAALLRLRAARPCAVETDAQFAWAASGLQTDSG